MAKRTGAAPTAVALDTADPNDAQGMWDAAEVRRSHLRVRTLVTLRWSLIAGQVALLALMAFVLGYDAPYALAAAVVGAGAWVNLLTGVASPLQRVMGDREATAQLGVDIVQIAAFIGLLGGTANPFVVLLIVPVTLAAATLPLRPVLLLAVLASLVSLGLSVVSLPYPAFAIEGRIALEYRLVAGVAVAAGIALVAAYVRQSAEESARMALALDVT
jgi:two-component system, sensor histidine kinase RegB